MTHICPHCGSPARIAESRKREAFSVDCICGRTVEWPADKDGACLHLRAGIGCAGSRERAEMSKLMDELRDDPSAVFEFEATLPTGIVMRGTVGPMINGKGAASIGFDRQPTEQEIEIASAAMSEALGCSPAITSVSRTDEQWQESQRILRKFFGGAQG